MIMSLKSGIKAPSKKCQPESSQNAKPSRNGTAAMSRSSSVSTLASVTEGKELNDGGKNSPTFAVGDRVWVNGTKPGFVQYLGETQFAPGIWAGVKLDDCDGKNDGSVGGVRYFDCEPQRGIFIRPHRLTKEAGSPPDIAGDSKQASPQGKSSSFTGVKQGPSPRGLISSPPKPTCSKLRPGERVVVNSAGGVKMGILRYIGPTDFAAGEWAGIELDEPLGKNDGSVGGKRYFECPMKHGLFSPVHKVSRAGGSTTLHNASHGGPLQNRSFSRESLNSSASSVASSRVGRVKLGITSLNNSQKPPKGPTAILSPTQIALQETLKEKEEHIERLLKERESERIEVATATTQLEEEKQKIGNLQEEYKAYVQESEAKINHLQNCYENVQVEARNASSLLEEEKRKIEDLQFRFEEEQILKSELEAEIEKDHQKIRELENLLKDEGKNEEFINRLAAMETALKEKTTLISKMESEMKDIQLQLSAKVADVVHLTSNLDAALQENETLKAETEKSKALESKVITVEEESKKLADEQNELSSQVCSMKECLEVSELKCSELQTKIDVLEKTVQSKMDEISNLNTVIESERTARLNTDQNMQAVEMLEMAQKEAQEKLSAITSEVNALSSELALKENLYREGIIKLESLTKALEEKDSEILKLNQHLTEAKKKYEDEMSINKSELQNLQEKMSVIEAECEKQRTELSEKDALFKEKIDALHAQLKEHEDVKTKLESEVANISNDLTEKDTVVSKLIEQLKEAKDEVSVLSRDNSESLVMLQNKITVMKEEYVRAQSEYNAAIERTCAEKENLSRLLKDQEEKALKTEALLTDLKKSLAQKENEVTELSSELQDSKNKVETISKDFNVLQLQVVELSTEKELFNKEKEELMQNLLNLRTEISNYSALFEEKGNEANQKQHAIQMLQKELELKEQQISELSMMIESSQKQLEQLKQQNERNMVLLETQVAEFKREQDKHFQGKEKILQDEIEKMRSQLTEKESVLMSSQTKMSEMQSEVQQKEQEIQELKQLLKEREDKLMNNLELQANILTELESKMQFLKAHCEELEKEKNEIAQQEQSAREARQVLEKTKDTLMRDKMEQEALVRDRDAKLQMLQQEVERMRREFIEHKDELQRKLDISEMELQAMKEFKKELEMQHGVLEELQQQLQESENDRCKLQQQLKCAMVAEEEKANLSKKISSLEAELQTSSNRINEEAQGKENLQNELQECRKQLKEKEEKLKVLESVQIQEKSQAVETSSAQQRQEQGEVVSSKIMTLSSQEKCNDKDVADAEVDDEKETLLSQINFLNSIIVDLQRKNEELKINQENSSDILDTDINFNGVRQLPPRLFCDICDMFDLHDTEDCPTQSSFVEEVPHSRHHGNRHEERPYCNNCEIFGHWTLECDDQQTF